MQNIPFFHSYEPINKKLTLRGASYIPKEIFSFANDIEILEASGCSLATLPEDFALLKKLRIAFFTNNLFEEVPEILAECPNLSMLSFKSCKIANFPENSLPTSLRWLILTQNRLTKLPVSIGKLRHLQKLSLAGNRLQSLPDEMSTCQELELIRIAANNFNSEPPNWLFTLPRLAWYGDSGNPFSKKSSLEQTALTHFSWDDIECGELIGESPSSHVFKGILKKTQHPVAIKVFKGELTSDGFPVDDMRAFVAAGKHDNLINILGELDPNDEKKGGLILGLIPPTYKNLGLPPNFETCTRDTFPLHTSFSLLFIASVLKDIASACQHLHARGIMHGDIYAHNILTNTAGHSFLGDFGAASFYDSTTNQRRERLDVRAFGCLVEDLLIRSEKENSNALFKRLRELQQTCLNENVSERPLFSEILLQFFQP